MWAAPLRMAIVAASALGLLAAAIQPACSRSGQPPAASSASPVAIYGELSESGCYEDPDSGVMFVAQEMTLHPPPAWMLCLEDGGSVPGCGVPCSPALPRSSP